MADLLTDILEALVAPQRGRGLLGEAAERDAIPIGESEALPESTLEGAGIAWPLTEQPYTGSTYYSLVSSDGLTVFEYPDETEYQDGNGDSGSVIHLAP